MLDLLKKALDVAEGGGDAQARAVIVQLADIVADEFLSNDPAEYAIRDRIAALKQRAKHTGRDFRFTVDGQPLPVLGGDIPAIPLGDDADHCPGCGEWDLVGGGHEVGEVCPDADRPCDVSVECLAREELIPGDDRQKSKGPKP